MHVYGNYVWVTQSVCRELHKSNAVASMSKKNILKVCVKCNVKCYYDSLLYAQYVYKATYVSSTYVYKGRPVGTQASKR